MAESKKRPAEEFTKDKYWGEFEGRKKAEEFTKDIIPVARVSGNEFARRYQRL